MKINKIKNGFEVEFTTVIDGKADDKFDKLFNKIIENIKIWCKENNISVSDRKVESVAWCVYINVQHGYNMKKMVDMFCVQKLT